MSRKATKSTAERPTGEGGRHAAERSSLVRTDQRNRLLEAIVEIVARDGYPEAKIGDIAARAGVSRATFYDLFETKEGCLLLAQRELAGRLNDRVELAIVEGEPAFAAQSALGALVEFAEREPFGFDFLMHEAMLAGPEAVQQRDRLMELVSRTIERAWANAAPAAPLLDMSPRLLLAGGVRELSLRMRRDGDSPRDLISALLDWVGTYAVEQREPRWRALVPSSALLGVRPERSAAPPPRRSLPRGRHRMAAETVRGVQRERIAYATAEAIREKGYANITVADIVATAGLSRDAFYAHFRDKGEAFEATVQLVFERLLATMGGAFFGASAGSWPEQVWETGLAFVSFLEDDPVLANFLFVGTYAPPAYIGRVHEFVLAFTVFVERGNRSGSRSDEVPRAISEAIVCAVLEAATFQVRHGRVADLRGLIPHLTYMVYVPFLGTEAARDFVEQKLAATKAAADARERR